MAEEISSSVTRAMSSTYWLTIWKVRSPGRLTAMPSAMVETEARVPILPSAMAACMLGAPEA